VSKRFTNLITVFSATKLNLLGVIIAPFATNVFLKWTITVLLLATALALETKNLSGFSLSTPRWRSSKYF
jgi:hypothetical protein